MQFLQFLNMKRIIIASFALLSIGCTKQNIEICHSVNDFYATNPIDVKKVFTASFKEVDCNLYVIDITHYNNSKEKIYMDFNHKIVQKIEQ